MILLDVNVLVYAHRRDVGDHEAIRSWLTTQLMSPLPFGVSDLVLSGFMRVVTHPRVFVEPSTLKDALGFVHVLRTQPNCVVLEPGPRHWDLFTALCRDVNAHGNDVPDAWHAALAIETGSEWISTDRGFRRFPDLRWRHPLD